MTLISKDNLVKFKKDCFAKRNLCIAWPTGNLLEFLKREMTGPYRRKYLGYALWVVTTAPIPRKDEMESKKFFIDYLSNNIEVREKLGNEKRMVLGQ